MYRKKKKYDTLVYIFKMIAYQCKYFPRALFSCNGLQTFSEGIILHSQDFTCKTSLTFPIETSILGPSKLPKLSPE